MCLAQPLANYRQLIPVLEILTNSQWGMKSANRRFSIADLLNACHDQAHQLTKAMATLKSKINPILFTPCTDSEFQRPDQKRIAPFQKILTDKSYTAIILYSKGIDIMAACGQLREAP